VTGYGPGFIQDGKEHNHHGIMKIQVEFSIKSSTLDHLDLTKDGSVAAAVTADRNNAIIHHNPIVPTKAMMMLAHEVGLIQNGLRKNKIFSAEKCITNSIFYSRLPGAISFISHQKGRFCET
jgi:hypothetical protein